MGHSTPTTPLCTQLCKNPQCSDVFRAKERCLDLRALHTGCPIGSAYRFLHSPPYEAEDVSGDLSADIRSNTVCKIQTDVVLFPIRLSDGIETAVSFHLISP